jgi:hypothetical protein
MKWKLGLILTFGALGLIAGVLRLFALPFVSYHATAAAGFGLYVAFIVVGISIFMEFFRNRKASRASIRQMILIILLVLGIWELNQVSISLRNRRFISNLAQYQLAADTILTNVPIQKKSGGIILRDQYNDLAEFIVVNRVGTNPYVIFIEEAGPRSPHGFVFSRNSIVWEDETLVGMYGKPRLITTNWYRL